MPDLRLARSALVAIAFLTRLPVRREPPVAAEFATAAILFPLVGAALGGLVAGTALASAQVMPVLLAAAIAVALELVVTGALHVDGLADAADGLAGRTPERALEIMRDHSLGTYGGAALVLDLLTKTAAIAALAETDALLPIVAAYAVSRAAPLPLAAGLSYARPSGGTGQLLADRLSIRGAAAGVLLAVLLAAVATGIWALTILACLAVVSTTVGWLANRRLGGVTGDVMGAAIELTAIAGLIVASGWSV